MKSPEGGNWEPKAETENIQEANLSETFEVTTSPDVIVELENNETQTRALRAEEIASAQKLKSLQEELGISTENTETQKSPERQQAERLLSPEQLELSNKVNARSREEMEKSIEAAEATGEKRYFHSIKTPENPDALDHIEDVKEGALSFVGIVSKYAPELVTPESVQVITDAISAHDAVIDTIPDANLQKRIAGTAAEGEIAKVARVRGFELSPEEKKSLSPAVLKAIEEKGGGNEERSADLAIKLIEELDTDKSYTPEMKEKVRVAVAATYPEVKFPPSPLVDRFGGSAFAEVTKDKVVVDGVDLSPFLLRVKEGKVDFSPGSEVAPVIFDQSKLTPESSLEEIATGIGDLSYSGRVDAESFKKYGNAEFKELNSRGIGIDIPEGATAEDILKLSPEKKAAIAKEMTSWIKDQISFVLGQGLRFEETLNTNKALNALPENAKNALKTELNEKWSNFKPNIMASIERTKQFANKDKVALLTNPTSYTTPAANEAFIQLLKEMDYDIAA